MNRITIDIALWLALLAGLAGHTRLRLHPPGPEPPPQPCVFCK